MVQKHLKVVEMQQNRRTFLKIGGGLLAGTCFSQFMSCGYPTQSIAAYDATEFPGDEKRKEFLVAKAGILAASPHNTQPWLFVIEPEFIEIHADLDKSLGNIDSFHREMYIGLGCALENCLIAAKHLGLNPKVDYFPSENETHVATIHFFPDNENDQVFWKYFTRRHTNRGFYSTAQAPASLKTQIESQASSFPINLTLISKPDKMSLLRTQIIEATEAIVNDEEMYADSDEWWRQDKHDINKHRDGLNFDANVTSAGTRFFGKLLPQVSTEQSGEFWIESTKNESTTASAFGILSGQSRYNRLEQVECGQAWQRIALWAESEGLATQPLNQIPERWDREDQLSLSPTYKSIMQSWLPQSHSGGQMIFRIGYPLDKALKSPRRPIEWVTMKNEGAE